MATKVRTLDRGLLGTVSMVFLILASAVGLFEMRFHPSSLGFDSQVNDVLSAGRHAERPDIAFRSHYTGVGGVDYALTFIVAMFLPGALEFSEEQQVQMIYFLFTIVNLIAIFSVEAFRSGNYGAWISYTSVLAVLYQSIGGAVLIPLWFLLFLQHSAQLSRYEPSLLHVPISHARALVPGHILGYMLPTIAIFLPLNDPGFMKKQALLAFWQPSPICVNILVVVMAQFYGGMSQRTTSTNSDVVYIKALHASCFIASLLTHAALVYRWTRASWSMADIFIPKVDFVQGSVPQVLYYIFQIDFAICFGAALLVTYIVVMDLKLLGRCNLSPVTVASSIILGSFLIGPAATISAAWWWREGKLRVDRKGTVEGKAV